MSLAEGGRIDQDSGLRRNVALQTGAGLLVREPGRIQGRIPLPTFRFRSSDSPLVFLHQSSAESPHQLQQRFGAGQQSLFTSPSVQFRAGRPALQPATPERAWRVNEQNPYHRHPFALQVGGAPPHETLVELWGNRIDLKVHLLFWSFGIDDFTPEDQ